MVIVLYRPFISLWTFNLLCAELLGRELVRLQVFSLFYFWKSKTVWYLVQFGKHVSFFLVVKTSTRVLSTKSRESVAYILIKLCSSNRKNREDLLQHRTKQNKIKMAFQIKMALHIKTNACSSQDSFTTYTETLLI